MAKIFSIPTAFIVALFVTSMVSAQESDGIPQKVLKELEFMVGQWETDVYENGEKVGTTSHERKWSPGRYCLLFSTSIEMNGEKFDATGISGWTRNGRAVVEHWYGSNGASLTVRYPLRKMKENVWEGTHHLVNADGTKRKGSCKLEKGNAQWIYTVEWEEDGVKKSSRSVTRKVGG